MENFNTQNFKSDTAYKKTLQGDIYQLKLLMACALQAKDSSSRFIMNTEVKEAEKFDDLVIEYEDSITVLQAKHSTTDKPYTLSDFKKDHKGEASLAKYFDSYVNILTKDSFIQRCDFVLTSVDQSDFMNVLDVPFFAYVLKADALYYVNKLKGLCEEITHDKDKLITLKRGLGIENNYLSWNEKYKCLAEKLNLYNLDIIKSITGHSHVKPINFIFFTNRSLSLADGLMQCFASTKLPDRNLSFPSSSAQCLKFRDDFIPQNQNYMYLYNPIIDSVKKNSTNYYEWLSEKLIINASRYQQSIEKFYQTLAEQIVSFIINGKYTLSLMGPSYTTTRVLLIALLENGQDNLYKFSEDFIENRSNLTQLHKDFRLLLSHTLAQRHSYTNQNLIPDLFKSFLQNLRFTLPKTPFSYVWESAAKKYSVELTRNCKNESEWIVSSEEAAIYIVGMFGELQFYYKPHVYCPLSDLTIYNTLHETILKKIMGINGNRVVEADQSFAFYVHRFLRDYRIQCQQPNEQELEKIICDKLKISFNFAGDEYYVKFQRHMLSWMKNLTSPWLSKADIENFFQTVTNQIQRLHLVGYRDHLVTKYQHFFLLLQLIRPLAYSTNLLQQMVNQYLY